MQNNFNLQLINNQCPYLHLATSEMWRWSGWREYWSKCLSVITVLCIIMVHKVWGVLTGRSTLSCLI